MHKTREAIDEQQKAEFILEGNKLIAEFMGYDFICGVSHYKVTPTTYLESYNTNKFHSSWDWLMPVVGKMFELNEFYDEYDYSMKLNDALLTINIEEIYKVILELIKHLNKNAANS